jgi:hypothetical protein
VAAQRALAEDYGFNSFNEALRSWIATVAVIEVGYEGEWEEYTHELLARDYLDELARRSGSYGAARVEEKVGPWDERFRAATVEEKEPHLPPMRGEPGWWQYRSPRKWRIPSRERDAL